MLARYQRDRLQLEEVHRFPNRAISFNGHLRWDVVALLDEVRTGLRKCAQQARIRSVGVDTWGVDYALLGPGDALLDMPVAYRDNRTIGCMEQVLARIPRQQIYAETGIQFLPFNTIFQLFAGAKENPELLRAAECFLMMPDLFAFLLTGEKTGERTNASTTQLLSLATGNWSSKLLQELNLPSEIMPPLVGAGTVLGELRAEVASDIGGCASFIATATHDTASAVAGIPADESDAWAFISCGTWSLIGRELAAPITTAAALAENFTNEAGVAGTIRFLKNIQGMWMLQECQREWAGRGRNFSNAELVRLASQARSFAMVIDPDDETFLSPASMLDAIKQFCRRTRQTMVDTPGAIARAILESLALKHRRALRVLETLTGGPVRVLHMVGGGTRNRLLCQWTADATNKQVLAGPAEATAIGNAAVQGIALGWFVDLQAARESIAKSVRMVSYKPRAQQDWADAEERFEEIVQRAARKHAAQA